MRRRIIEPCDIGEENQKVRTRHGGDSRRETIVVAVTNLAGCDGVVLVDDRYRVHHEEAAEGCARIEIAATFFRVLQGQKDLARDNAVSSEGARPLAGERNLPYRRRGLAVFELERSLRQPGDRATKRDRPRGHDNDARATLVQRSDVLRGGFEPFASHAPDAAADQDRRPAL